MFIYPKKRNHRYYRKLWEQHHGRPIPKDEFGRSYDIHHIDGDYTNNSIENLIAVSIQEHYDIHYSQGDWGACYMIARRMEITPEFISELVSQNQLKRVADGTHHWLGDKNPSRRKVADGTHHMLKQNGGSEKVSQQQKKRVADGTHNLLGGIIQKKTALKKISDGTHHFCDSKTQTQINNKAIENGTHASKRKACCIYCKMEIPLNNFSRYHGNNCKLKCD